MSLRLRADVSVCDTDTGVVLLDERTGHYWQLNRSGALILNALLDGDPPHRIAETLTGRYQVTEDAAAEDIDALLTQLTHAALVTPLVAR